MNEETGLYEDGTGLYGHRRRKDQAISNLLDQAIEESGGEVLVDPFAPSEREFDDTMESLLNNRRYGTGGGSQ